jgi:hypothetical protein
MENKNNLNNEEYNPFDFNITERKFVNIKKNLKTKAKEKGFDLRKKIEEPVITPRTKK